MYCALCIYCGILGRRKIGKEKGSYLSLAEGPVIVYTIVNWLLDEQENINLVFFPFPFSHHEPRLSNVGVKRHSQRDKRHLFNWTTRSYSAFFFETTDSRNIISSQEWILRGLKNAAVVSRMWPWSRILGVLGSYRQLSMVNPSAFLLCCL